MRLGRLGLDLGGPEIPEDLLSSSILGNFLGHVKSEVSFCFLLVPVVFNYEFISAETYLILSTVPRES